MKNPLNNTNNHKSYFLDNLTIVFIYLKLTEQVTWSWLIVLSPMLVSLVLAFIVAFMAGLYLGFKEGGLK
jgi:hypothetical protein